MVWHEPHLLTKSSSAGLCAFCASDADSAPLGAGFASAAAVVSAPKAITEVVAETKIRAENMHLKANFLKLTWQRLEVDEGTIDSGSVHASCLVTNRASSSQSWNSRTDTTIIEAWAHKASMARLSDEISIG